MKYLRLSGIACCELPVKLDLIKEYSAGMDFQVASYQRYIRDIERQLDTSKEEYTIAFVGMFNSGKSTVINSLLGLTGGARLSEEDRPDTVKRICIFTGFPTSRLKRF